MVVNCYTYWGQDDDEKIIYVEKKTLSANDERVEKYLMEYEKIQAYSLENGYRLVDIALVQEEDFPMRKGRSR